MLDKYDLMVLCWSQVCCRKQKLKLCRDKIEAVHEAHCSGVFIGTCVDNVYGCFIIATAEH